MRQACPGMSINSNRVRTNKYVLANNTIFLEAQVIHGFVDRFLNLLPVGSSLNELIHIL